MPLQLIDARNKTVEQIAQEVHAAAATHQAEGAAPAGAGAAPAPGAAAGGTVRMVMGWLAPVLAEVLASQGPQALQRLISLLMGGGGGAAAAGGAAPGGGTPAPASTSAPGA